MDLIKKTNIDFVSKRSVFFRASIIINVVGLVLVAIFGVKLGIDFTGGTEVAVAIKGGNVTTDDVRASMAAIGYGGGEIKSFGQEGQYLIRVGESGQGTTVSAKIMTQLGTSFAGKEVVLLQSQKIDAKISSELALQSTIALIVAFVIMLLYVAFRFEFVYGLGAIIGLLHDVLMAFVISALFDKLGIVNLEFNINSVAAYLTILGYSINDAVVVFDRIRENRDKHKGLALSDLINHSLNETLSRTIITGVSVLAALLVLVFFGGDVLEGFAFTMFVGIVVGTYSSIYISSSFVIWYTDRVKHKIVGTVHTEKA
ncbi:MAG: protein translocase subunit SecF [Candidatus Kapabacteria bacterium]|nr:protein translocase subunit SecF [Candidatus Kapabacteria bacterium]